MTFKSQSAYFCGYEIGDETMKDRNVTELILKFIDFSIRLHKEKRWARHYVDNEDNFIALTDAANDLVRHNQKNT